MNEHEVLKLLNSDAGRHLLGIKGDLPIVRFDNSWVEMWTGKFQNGKPLMQAVVWSSDRVADKILLPYERMKIADAEYQPITDPYRGFLHFSGLELNRRLPQVFLTAVTKNPAAGEGRLYYNTGSTSWATARGAASAVGNDGLVDIHALGTANPNIQRVEEPFNTSTIGSMVVSAADMQLYRDDSVDGFANASTTTLDAVPSQMVDPTSAALADYSKLTFTSRGNIALASTSNSAYFTITLSNFTEITGTAYTKYMLTMGVDVSNTDPVANNNQISCQNKSSGNPPKLNITYTLSAGGSFLLNFV